MRDKTVMVGRNLDRMEQKKRQADQDDVRDVEYAKRVKLAAAEIGFGLVAAGIDEKNVDAGPAYPAFVEEGK